jgi:Tfp pilus assembly PilM family ATPase
LKIQLRRPALLDRLESFFLSPPCPPVILQLSSAYLSGIQVAVKEKKVKQHLITPLPARLVEPHFERTNLPDRAALAGIIKDGLGRLRAPGEKTACLLPEACFRVFVLNFESLPASESEREGLILWRAKKQMPVLPEDIRLSYQAMESRSSVKVVAALARASVIQEYEALFAGLGLELGVVSAPALSLVNVIDWQTEKDVVLVNLEEDSLGLVAISRSEVALYRVKPLAGEQTEARRADNLVKEIENTFHFIEDREKQAIQSLWFRTGLLEGGEVLLSELGERLSVPVKPILSASLAALAPAEQTILLPLVGQIP